MRPLPYLLQHRSAVPCLSSLTGDLGTLLPRGGGCARPCRRRRGREPQQHGRVLTATQERALLHKHRTGDFPPRYHSETRRARSIAGMVGTESQQGLVVAAQGQASCESHLMDLRPFWSPRKERDQGAAACTRRSYDTHRRPVGILPMAAGRSTSHGRTAAPTAGWPRTRLQRVRATPMPQGAPTHG